MPSGAGAAPILDMDNELWYSTVDANLNSVCLCRHGGRLIRSLETAVQSLIFPQPRDAEGCRLWRLLCNKICYGGFHSATLIELAKENIKGIISHRARILLT